MGLDSNMKLQMIRRPYGNSKHNTKFCSKFHIRAFVSFRPLPTRFSFRLESVIYPIFKILCWTWTSIFSSYYLLRVLRLYFIKDRVKKFWWMKNKVNQPDFFNIIQPSGSSWYIILNESQNSFTFTKRIWLSKTIKWYYQAVLSSTTYILLSTGPYHLWFKIHRWFLQ